MKTISIINLKGGVAKSISSINIGYILAAVHGARVLLIDNDKQGNTSKFFGLYDYDHKGISEIMTERGLDAADVIQHTRYEGLDLITANMNLLRANKEVLLDSSRSQQTRLRKALQSASGSYDYCIIDNAPDINMSVINALVASDDVLVPIKIDKFAFDGLEVLKEQMEDLQDFNSGLKITACFVTMFQRNVMNAQGYSWLADDSKYPMFKTVIRNTVKVGETTFEGVPLLEYAKNSTATKDYIALVAEYLERWGKK
jgi:chromosome partitioning protein